MRVLLLSSSASVRAVVEGLLGSVAELTAVDGPLDVVEALGSQPFDVLVAPLAEQDLVQRARRLRPSCRIILVAPAGQLPSVVAELPDAIVSADVEGLAQLPALLRRPAREPRLWSLLECSAQPALLRSPSGELRVNAAMRALAGEDPLSLVPRDLVGSSSLRLKHGARWLDLTLSEEQGWVLGLASDVTDAEELSAEIGALRLEAGARREPDAELRIRQVVHDLKEPLGTLDWHLEEGRLDEARTVAARMRALVGELLPTRRALLAADCEVVFAEAVANLAGLIDQTGAVVRRGPLPELALSEAECLQLLQNLVGNALKHGGRTVRVLAERVSDTHWELRVLDDGPGIPSQLRAQVFELDPTRGIGMSTCRRIAEARGGGIRLEEVEQGTCVVLRLPGASEEPTQLGHH